MALSKLTANRHNIKRAEALKSYGISTLDLPSAKPNFKGYGAGTCALCGQKNLKWLFQIHFDEPQGLVALAKIECEIDREDAVTITPVGSKCITDWIDAIPESAEKLELVKRWEIEMRKCKAAMKAKIVEDLCAEAGFETPADAFNTYMDILRMPGSYKFMRQAISPYDMNFMRRNANKVFNKTLSRKTCQDWVKMLVKLNALPRPTQAEVAEAEQADAEIAAEVKEILDKGKALFDEHCDKLNSYYTSAFLDIHKKVTESGKFRSDRQKAFFTDMMKKMEV